MLQPTKQGSSLATPTHNTQNDDNAAINKKK